MLRNVILFLSISLVAKAQSYREDMLAVSRNMTGSQNYALTVEYHLFVDGNMKQPFQERELEIKQMGRNFTARYSTGLESLYNENFIVSVDRLCSFYSCSKWQECK